LAIAIDAAGEVGDIEGLKRALFSLAELDKASMSSGQRALTHYYTANALAGLRTLRSGDSSWWDQPLLEREILQHRLALSELEKTEAVAPLKCHVLTNLANAFNSVGRFTEALNLWNRALDQDAAFGMALGNRGLGYFRFARYVQTAPEQSLLLRDCNESLHLALKSGVEEHALDEIKALHAHISSWGNWAKFEAPKMPLPADILLAPIES
jgi:tetratricopeptide (TPR) repeat protein